MSLKITMIKAPATVAMAAVPLVIGEQGGTFGRDAGNTWVLEDPEMYLSSLHCQFSFENGRYYLIDHSTNGTFYGGSHDPMGKGTRLPISNNDQFFIGDYQFVLSIDGQARAASDPFADAGGGDISPQPVGGDSLDGFATRPLAGGHEFGREPLSNAAQASLDPLEALAKARGGNPLSPIPSGTDPFGMPAHSDPFGAATRSDPFGAATHSDGANSLNQHIDLPRQIAPQPAQSLPPGAIPDDWDADVQVSRDVIQPAPRPDNPPPQRSLPPEVAGDPELRSRQQELEQANLNIQVELDQLKQQIRGQSEIREPPGGSSANQADTTFIAALGLERHNLSDQEVMQINQLGGEVLRQMIGGLMQVLGSRSSIKNEFRMNVTTIQPVENNPLKFSANVDDALENMFIKQGNAFKNPIESVREGFDGVAEHQLAVLAGIREAYKSVVERFDPVILEQNFSKQNRGGLLPGSQKAKSWDCYKDYYQELAGDIDKSFQHLFGNGFVRAYEDQLQKLAVSRKAKKFDNDN